MECKTECHGGLTTTNSKEKDARGQTKVEKKENPVQGEDNNPKNEEDSDGDLFNSSDDDSPENNAEQEIREGEDESVVQETCRGTSCNVSTCNHNDVTPWVSKKVDETEYSKNQNTQQIDAPLKNHTGNPGPKEGIDEVAIISPIIVEEQAQIEKTQLAEEEANVKETHLFSRGISGKLKELLSRNTPLQKKLKDEEDEISSVRRSRGNP
ncbi:hypothetical protein L2E82_53799 [Cichorium intybus]|nr:hypothetical protein L2E82_53799 [Cichorium intybus]